jgi:hypothetical protein
MNELYEEIGLARQQISEGKYSEDTQIAVFRGFLLELLAKSYGYTSFDQWREAMQDEEV